MAVLSALVFIGLAAGYSEAAWCVCRPGADPNALQSAIDYACGHGADCGPISANGPCYQPNTRLAHCSYAVNSYFQRASQAPAACDFSGTATTTTVDPSYTGCQIPSLIGGSSPPTSAPAIQTGFGPAATGYNPLPYGDGSATARTAGIALAATAAAAVGLIFLA
ncbi:PLASMODESMATA CALLOSE-BINDING PROTEIN 2-like isoform X1 [Wolffia australiana]